MFLNSGPFVMKNGKIEPNKDYQLKIQAWWFLMVTYGDEANRIGRVLLGMPKVIKPE